MIAHQLHIDAVKSLTVEKCCQIVFVFGYGSVHTTVHIDEICRLYSNFLLARDDLYKAMNYVQLMEEHWSHVKLFVYA